MHRRVDDRNRVLQPAFDEQLLIAAYNLEDWRQLDEAVAAPSKTKGAKVDDVRDSKMCDKQNQAHTHLMNGRGDISTMRESIKE